MLSNVFHPSLTNTNIFFPARRRWASLNQQSSKIATAQLRQDQVHLQQQKTLLLLASQSRRSTKERVFFYWKLRACTLRTRRRLLLTRMVNLSNARRSRELTRGWKRWCVFHKQRRREHLYLVWASRASRELLRDAFRRWQAHDVSARFRHAELQATQLKYRLGLTVMRNVMATANRVIARRVMRGWRTVAVNLGRQDRALSRVDALLGCTLRRRLLSRARDCWRRWHLKTVRARNDRQLLQQARISILRRVLALSADEWADPRNRKRQNQIVRGLRMRQAFEALRAHSNTKTIKLSRLLMRKLLREQRHRISTQSFQHWKLHTGAMDAKELQVG